MQNLEALKENFQRDGFVHLPGFMQPTEMDKIEHYYEQVLRDVVPGLPRHDAMYEDYERSETLKQVNIPAAEAP